jgi:hypothetical protein
MLTYSKHNQFRKLSVQYKWLVLGVPSIATIFISLLSFSRHYMFGLYMPSSGEIYTVIFKRLQRIRQILNYNILHNIIWNNRLYSLKTDPF